MSAIPSEIEIVPFEVMKQLLIEHPTNVKRKALKDLNEVDDPKDEILWQRSGYFIKSKYDGLFRLKY